MKKKVKKLPTETLLEQRRRSFEDTRNPLYVIEAFVLSDKKNMNHPGWIFGFFKKGFKKFLRSRGKRRLDECLGLARRKGQRSWFTEKDLRERNELIGRKVREEIIRDYRKKKVGQACLSAYDRERKKKGSAFDLIGFQRFRDVYYKNFCSASSRLKTIESR